MKGEILEDLERLGKSRASQLAILRHLGLSTSDFSSTFTPTDDAINLQNYIYQTPSPLQSSPLYPLNLAL